MFFAEKIQNIYKNLSLLLPRFKRICVSRLVDLPRQINTAVIGENKLRLVTNGTIQEVNARDLSGATYIHDRMFYNCSSLVSVSMPNSIINIGDRAFYGCDNLQNVIISNNVTILNSYAFMYCRSLKSITIPDGVTNMGYRTFYDCSSLASMYLHPTEPPTLDDVTTIPSTTIIHVPIGRGNVYRGSTNWSNFEIVEDIEL